MQSFTLEKCILVPPGGHRVPSAVLQRQLHCSRQSGGDDPRRFERRLVGAGRLPEQSGRQQAAAGSTAGTQHLPHPRRATHGPAGTRPTARSGSHAGAAITPSVDSFRESDRSSPAVTSQHVFLQRLSVNGCFLNVPTVAAVSWFGWLKSLFPDSAPCLTDVNHSR